MINLYICFLLILVSSLVGVFMSLNDNFYHRFISAALSFTISMVSFLIIANYDNTLHHHRDRIDEIQEYRKEKIQEIMDRS